MQHLLQRQPRRRRTGCPVGARLRGIGSVTFHVIFCSGSPGSRSAPPPASERGAHGAGAEPLAALSGPGLEPGMSGTKLEDSPPCRNWSSAPELNETQEPFLNPTDYDDEEFLRYLWREYLHPKEYEWVLIAGYIIVFVVALIGNVLGECRSGQPPRGPPRPRARGCQYPFLPAGMHTKRSLLLGWGYYYYFFFFNRSFRILGTRTEPWNGDPLFLQGCAGSRAAFAITWVPSARRGAGLSR